MLSKKEQFSKRLFDVIVACLVFPFVIIPMIILLLLAAIDIKRTGLFIQERVGKDGKLFKLYKIRTLKGKYHDSVHEIKANETALGKWLRTTKLDEIPQLWNVLVGDMSWVGPRPDVPGYADVLEGEDRIILSIRPGVTGPATIKYKNEEALLLAQDDANKYNDTVIWPDKVKINKEYIKNWSLLRDIRLLFASFFK